MRDAFMAFRECGWPSWFCLFIAVIGLTAGGIGLILLLTKARRFAWIPGGVALLFGLGAMAVGFLGQQWALARLESILSDPDLRTDLDPAQAARIREEGRKEAGQCVTIGAGSGALPFLMGAVATGLGLTLRKRKDD